MWCQNTSNEVEIFSKVENIEIDVVVEDIEQILLYTLWIVLGDNFDLLVYRYSADREKKYRKAFVDSNFRYR